MDKEATLTALSALAHEGRFDLIRHLIHAGPAGLVVSDLATLSDAQMTTTSAQLSTLAQANLVRTERQGRTIRYRADYKTLREMIITLMADCCQGQSEVVGPIIDTFTSPSCCPSKGKTP
ncbi:MAG: metalloregulator ArsR/SmtB family transcription factor [Pseudomonadota bacterium]